MTWDAHAGELYVGGRWVPAATGDRIVVRSPHDHAEVGVVAAAAPPAVDAAVAAAAAAFEAGSWSRRPPAERIAVLEELGPRYEARQAEMARCISLENGSPLSFSTYGQVGAVPMFLDGFLDAARALAWEDEVPGAFGTTRVWREPVGVVAAITAWNVPQILIVAKLVPALLAGCSVVVKPAPEAPIDAVLLAELLDGLGLPEGVVSVLPGGPEVGHHLVTHPGVDKVAFTGSTAVGRSIAATCGEHLKRASLELGGKSAAIVLDDADVERTAAGLRFASFMNNGQACAAQTRVLAPRARYDEVVDALHAATASFVVGDPLDEATEVGPLVSERQRDRVQGYLDLGVREGARRVGSAAPVPDHGWYVPPTVFADVDNGMRIAREEIFGPVVCVIPYDDEDDAVRIANDSPYGLGGSVWTADPAHGLDLARRVRTGMFGVNAFAPDPAAPFGGYKASGIGREYGRFGLEAFVEVKAVHGA